MSLNPELAKLLNSQINYEMSATVELDYQFDLDEETMSKLSIE